MLHHIFQYFNLITIIQANVNMNPISDFHNRPMTTHYMSLKKQYLKYKLLTVIQCFSIHKDKISNRELPIWEFPLNQNGVRQN